MPSLVVTHVQAACIGRHTWRNSSCWPIHGARSVRQGREPPPRRCGAPGLSRDSSVTRIVSAIHTHKCVCVCVSMVHTDTRTGRRRGRWPTECPHAAATRISCGGNKKYTQHACRHHRLRTEASCQQRGGGGTTQWHSHEPRGGGRCRGPVTTHAVRACHQHLCCCD